MCHSPAAKTVGVVAAVSKGTGPQAGPGRRTARRASPRTHPDAPRLGPQPPGQATVRRRRGRDIDQVVCSRSRTCWTFAEVIDGPIPCSAKLAADPDCSASSSGASGMSSAWSAHQASRPAGRRSRSSSLLSSTSLIALSWIDREAAHSEGSAADLDRRLWRPRNAAGATARSRARGGRVNPGLARGQPGCGAQRLAAKPVGARTA